MYDQRNLTVLAYGNGFTAWHYASDDSLDEACVPGYFLPAHDMVRKGDMIFGTFRFSSRDQITGGVMMVTEVDNGGVSVRLGVKV